MSNENILETTLEVIKVMPNDLTRLMNWVLALDKKVEDLRPDLEQNCAEVLEKASLMSGEPPPLETLKAIRNAQEEMYYLTKEKEALIEQAIYYVKSYAERIDEEIARLQTELGGEEKVASMEAAAAASESDSRKGRRSGRGGGRATADESSSSESSDDESSDHNYVPTPVVGPTPAPAPTTTATTALPPAATTVSSAVPATAPSAAGAPASAAPLSLSAAAIAAVNAAAAALAAPQPPPALPRVSSSVSLTSSVSFVGSEVYPKRVQGGVTLLVKPALPTDPDWSKRRFGPNNEQLFCICRQGPSGIMHPCDAPYCPYEYFHLGRCIEIDKQYLTGSWYCNWCRFRSWK